MSDNKVVTAKVDIRADSTVLTAAAERARTSLKNLTTTIEDMQKQGKSSIDRLQSSFDNLKIKSALNIEAERAQIVSSFNLIRNSGVASADEINRAHTAMKTRLADLSNGVSGVSNRFSSLTGITGLAGAALAGMSLTALISELHTAGMAAERLRNSFAAATGSIGKGAAEYAYARSEAQRLGLDLQSTADAYLKLTASAKGTSLEGEKTQQVFSSVAGASRALGLSGDQMSGALLAISQMMSKGTVQAEELRGQLGERLPGAFQIAARSMGVTTAELGKMLEGGKVMANDFLPKFAAELLKTFPPGEEAMRGMTAETTRLKTALFELKVATMDSGGESLFTGIIRGLKVAVEDAGTLVKILGRVGPKPVLSLDDSPWGPLLADPVTKSDKMLMNTDYGISGHILKPDITPDLGSLAAQTREDRVDFGSMLSRDTPLEKTKKTKIPRQPPEKIASVDTGVINDTREKYLAYLASVNKREVDLARQTEAAKLYENEQGYNKGLVSLQTYLEAKHQAVIAELDTERIAALQNLDERQKDLATKSTAINNEAPDEKSLQAYYEALKKVTEAESTLEKVQSQRALQLRKNADEERTILINKQIADAAALSNWEAVRRRGEADDLNNTKLFMAMKNDIRETSTLEELARIDREQKDWEWSWAMNAESYKEYERRMLEISKFYEAQKKGVAEKEKDTKIKLAVDGFNNVANVADAFYKLSGQKNKAAFKVYQVSKSAETVITTHNAAMKAFDSLASIPYVGFALGAAAAASVYATGAVALDGIWAASDSGGGSLGGSGGSGGSSGSANYGGAVTQPVDNSTPSQKVEIIINIKEQYGTDSQAFTKWAEDMLYPTIRDLSTRGVTFK